MSSDGPQPIARRETTIGELRKKRSERLDDQATEYLITLDLRNQGFKGFFKWLTHVAQTYSLLVVLGMVLACSLGLELTWFLDLASLMAERYGKTQVDWETNRATYIWTSVEAVLLPFMIISGALLLYSIVKLVRGQFLNVSFARARAVMLVATIQAEGAQEYDSECHIKMTINESTAWWIDWWFSHPTFWAFCGVFSGLVPMVAIIQTNVKSFDFFTCAYGGLALGGSLWASITIVWHAAADVKIALRSGRKEIARTKRYHAVDALQAYMLKYHIDPWSWKLSKVQKDRQKDHYVAMPGKPMPDNEAHFDEMNLWLEELITNSSGYDLQRTPASRIRGFLSRIAACTLFIGNRLPSCTQERIKQVLSGICCLMVIIVLVTFIVEVWILPLLCISALLAGRILWFWQDSLSHTLKSPGFLLFLFMTAVALIFFVCLGFHTKDPLFAAKTRPLPRSSGNDKWVFHQRDAVMPYPVCSMRWGADSELNVIDLAILSSYAYDDNDGSYEPGGAAYQNTSQTFNDDTSTATIINHQPYSHVGRVIATRFFNRNSGKNTTVLAIKGSSEPFDFYADMRLWAPIAAFQALVPFLDLLDLLPNWLFAYLFKMFQKQGASPFEGARKMYKDLNASSNDTFVLTGHSLGGGIAIAAGGNLKVPAVSFSGPGSHFTRYRFGTTMEHSFRSAVDVKPVSDLIHKFDRHDEAGQRIACQASSPVKCHSIYSTICELWRVCGYHKPRNFKHMCHGVFHKNTPPKREFLTESNFGN